MPRSRTAARTIAPEAPATGVVTVPNLSRERIMQQAIAMLDVEGLTGLSMRRLAERLDAGAMSLYWYFSTKDDLLRAAADAVVAEVDIQQVPVEWTAAIRHLLLEIRRVLLAHPWAIQIITQSPQLGPNSLRLMACVLEVLSRGGIARDQLDIALTVVFAYVLGVAVGEHLWLSTIRSDAASLQSVSAASEAFPGVAAFLATAAGADPEHRLECGISAIIAGLEATVVRS